MKKPRQCQAIARRANMPVSKVCVYCGLACLSVECGGIVYCPECDGDNEEE